MRAREVSLTELADVWLAAIVSLFAAVVHVGGSVPTSDELVDGLGLSNGAGNDAGRSTEQGDGGDEELGEEHF